DGSAANNYSPRWSPDGHTLAFLSDRGADGVIEVWGMPADGGTAKQLTELKGGVSDFVWAPDSQQLALIAGDDPDPATIAAKKDANAGQHPTAPPIVLDRYQFKDDDGGYLDHHRSHLYLFDLVAHRATLLTPGDHDEWLPAWSPDGAHLVYVSKRGADPD